MADHNDSENVKKKIRMMDHDRQKYAQAMQGQMLKQQEHITTIKKDNDKLRQDLAAQTGGRYTFGEHEKLASMEQDSEGLDSKIQFEKLRQTDIEKKLHISRLETMQIRRSMGSVTVTQDNTALIDKQVHVLENRLDQALVKFNEALSFNRDLRQSIDNLREERKVFNNIYKKLEQELHGKKRDMADVIERSNKDYEERDALQLQLDSLRSAAKEDAKKYEEHFQSLEAMMQQYKAQREQQQQQAAAQALQQQKQQLATDSTANNNGGTNGGANDRSQGKGGDKKGMSNDKSDTNLTDTAGGAPQDHEADLQEVIDQLKEATGIQDLDILYAKFVKAEEHNFSMYNFVNELNSEVELLDAEIAQLKEQLHSERGDVQRRKMLKDLENELARTEQQHENTVEKTVHLKDTLDVIRSLTQEIFTKIGCSAEQTAELLGTSECTEINLLDFLGIIEQRTNEVMYQYNIAADNLMKRKAAGKDEVAKRKRERRQAERDARIEAGENVPPEEEDDADYGDEEGDEGAGALVETGAVDGEPTKSKFLGVGPQVPTGTIDLTKTVKSMGLPTTNAGEGNDAEDLDDDAPISLDDLRARAALNLQNKKDERGGRRRKDKKKTAN